MDKMNPSNKIAKKEKKVHDPTGLGKVQESVKILVDRGELSKEAGIQIILQKAIEILRDLKIPEDQAWEVNEYGYMGRSVV